MPAKLHQQQAFELADRHESRLAWALVLAGLAPSLLGVFAPEAWWGSHWLAFLPRPWAGLVALLALATGLLAARLAARGPAAPAWLARRPLLTALVVAAGYALLCHSLGMASDIYGDARRNLAHVDQLLARGNPEAWREILGLDLLHRETGERFVLNLVWLLARALDCSAATAFERFNAGWGFLFALTWTRAVLGWLRGGPLRWLLLPLGLLSGLLSLFTEHAEIYAPAATLALLFMIAAQAVLAGGRRRWLPVLAALFLLAAKAHFANLILAVPLLLVAAALLRGGARGWITRRHALTWVLAPLAIAFAVLYFGVMSNHAVSRFVDDLGRARLFFLPLIDAETNGAPAYTLFAFWHLADFLNQALLWSTPAWLLVLGAWALRRRHLRSTPELVLAELCLLLYAGIFFVTNPVLGMPRDWDLFLLPAAALLVYALGLARALPAGSPLPRPLLGAAFALLVLGLPMLVVDQRPALLAARLESIGVHSYRSYWKGATYLLNVAAELDPPAALDRRLRSYARIRPHALPADPEQADLAWRLSRLLRERKEFARALPYALDAVRASRGNALCLYELGLVQFGLGDFAAAFRTAQQLVAIAPATPDYSDLAYKSALRAGDGASALDYCQRLLTLRPGDAEATRLLARIRAQLDAATP